MSDSPQVKPDLFSSRINFVYDFPHELRSNWRLQILGNKEIPEKSRSWMQAESSAQIPLEK